MAKNSNAFKMTKSESDMRESSREMEQWLPPKTTSRKASSGRLASKGGASGKMATDTLKATTDANTTKSSEWRAAPNKMSFKPSPNSMQEFKESPGKEKTRKEDKNNVDIGDFGSWLGKNAMNGLGRFNRGLMATADFLLPTEFLGKYDFVSGLNNFYSNESDRLDAEAKEASKKMGGKGWGYMGEAVSSTVSVAPEIILGILSGGASAAGSLANTGATAAKTGVGLVDDAFDVFGTVARTIKERVKKPDMIMSVAQDFGNEYNDALENGENEYGAMATAGLKSAGDLFMDLPDANIIQSVLRDKGYSKGVHAWGKMVDDGLWGSLQGMADASISSLTTDENTPLYSADDENAVINPERIFKDFLGGAALGGFEEGINKSINPNGNDVSGSVSKPAVNKQEPKSLLSNIENVKTKVVDNLRRNIGLYGVKRAMDKAVKEWGEYIEGLSDIEFEEYLKSLRNG